MFQSRGDHDVAEEYLEKALSIAENNGKAEIEFACNCNLTLSKLVQDNFQEAIPLLLRSIEKSENMRGFLQDSDQIKVSFADMHAFPYLSDSSHTLHADPRELSRFVANRYVMFSLYSGPLI